MYLSSQYLPLISLMFHGRPHSMNGNAAASAVIFFCICNAIWTVVTRAYSLYPLCINHINNKTKLWFLLQQQQNNCKEEHFLLLGLFFRQIGTWYDKWTPDTTPFVSLFAFAFFKCSQTSLSLSQLFFFLHNKMYTEPLRQVAVRTPLLADATSNFCCQIGSHY